MESFLHSDFGQEHPENSSEKLPIKRILSLLEESGSLFEDIPIPPSDARAHLADFNIHRSTLDAMCAEVANEWPDVQSIECGVHSGYPYIAIRICPCDESAKRKHDVFIRSLREKTPAFLGVTFYCFGEDPPHAISTATQLYKRTT